MKQCPECGRWVRVKLNGVVAKHMMRKKDNLAVVSEKCPYYRRRAA